MNTLKRWIEQVYADNGLWPTLIVGIVIAALLIGGCFLDIKWAEWLE